MKLYFSTKQIPQLANLPLSERLNSLRKAENRLTVPEKFVLNLCKLIIIIPVFALLLRTGEDWLAPVWAMLFMLAYPLIIKPFQFSMCVKYLPSNKEQGDD